MTKPGKRKKTKLVLTVPNLDALFTDADLEDIRTAVSVEDAREWMRSNGYRMIHKIIRLGEQLRKEYPDPEVPAARELTADEQAFVDWLFPLWAQVTRRGDAQSTRTKARVECVVARFREGRTREAFEAILRWCAGNDWMSGRDPKTNGRSFDDLINVFSSSDKFDKYHALAERSRTTARASDYLRAGGPTRPERTL